MEEKKNIKLVILGIVAILAIIILVLLFKNALTGAQIAYFYENPVFVYDNPPVMYEFTLEQPAYYGIQPKASRTLQDVPLSDYFGYPPYPPFNDYSEWTTPRSRYAK